MKTWQLIAVLGGLGLVAVIVLMRATQVKATPTNTSQGFGGISAQGLAALVTSGAALVQAIKPAQSTSYINEGTYHTGGSTISGNSLVDTSTGKELVYGTD